MKRITITILALLCLVAPGAAVAGDVNPQELYDQITRLQDRNDALQDRVDHKADQLACERAKRRVYERALRTGEPVGVLASCS